MSLETCTGCGAGIIKRHVWKAMSHAERETAREYGMRDKYASGQCRACWQREDRRARGIAPPAPVDVAAQRAARLEDLAWMAETGESLPGAAKRLGITERSLERFLRQWDRDILATLVANNPRDWNTQPTGSDVCAISSTPARRANEARRNERRRSRRGVVAA